MSKPGKDKENKIIEQIKDSKTTQTLPNNQPSDNLATSIGTNAKTLQKSFKQFINCSYMKQVQTQKQEFYLNICKPIGKFYRQLPSQITSNKLYLIAGFPEDRRLMTLNLLVLAAVGLTLRSSSGLAIMLKFTKTLRNSVFTYMGGGLLIVPEIYNPWIREQVFG